MSLANDDTQAYCILNCHIRPCVSLPDWTHWFKHRTGCEMDEMSSHGPDYHVLWTGTGKTECQYSKHKIFVQPFRRTFSKARWWAFLCLYPSSILCQWTFSSPCIVCPFYCRFHLYKVERINLNDVEHLCWQNGALWPLFSILWVIRFVYYILNYFWSCI